MVHQFSAGAQTLGYLFQARRALLVLLRGREECEVIVEGLDDIAVTSSDQLQLEQLKHHITGTASLTDASEDLWKTIRVWSSHLLAGRLDASSTTLTLITTGSAPEGSIAAQLRDDDGRDEVSACRRLNEIAETSTNKGLAKAFEAFRALGEAGQRDLVRAIRILDDSSNIITVADEICHSIRYATRPEFLRPLCERLEGWWFSRVAYHLVEGSETPITQFEVHEKLSSIAEQFRNDDLPIDFGSTLPEVIDPENDSRLFVRQLRELTSNVRRIENAIVDYYRAFQQRSRWLREDLLIDAEIEEYEEKLVDAWERYRLALEDEEMFDPDDADSCRRFGLKVYRWIELEADVRIRPQVSEGYVMRGSYHMLADEWSPQVRLPRVWWHPLFLDHLKTLLSA